MPPSTFLLPVPLDTIYWRRRRLRRLPSRPRNRPIPANALRINLRGDRHDPRNISLPPSPPPEPPEMSAWTKFQQAKEELQTLFGAPPERTAPTPQEMLSRARAELQSLYPQTPVLTGFENQIVSGIETGSLAAFGLATSITATANPVVASPGLANPISAEPEPSLPQPSPQQYTTSPTLNSPHNTAAMFRRKPVPSSTSAGPDNTPSTPHAPNTPGTPKSLNRAKLLKSPSLADTLNIFTLGKKQPYTSKAHMKEIDLNLNGNGTSAPFLRQDASKPGRRAKFVEDFGDDGVVDETITGPLGGCTVGDCRPEKMPLTLSGTGYTGYVNPKRVSDPKPEPFTSTESTAIADASATAGIDNMLSPSDATLRPSTGTTAATSATAGTSMTVLSEGISVSNNSNYLSPSKSATEQETGLRRVSVAFTSGLRKVSSVVAFAKPKKGDGGEYRPPVPPKDY